jgi:hypothetical protein
MYIFGHLKLKSRKFVFLHTYGTGVRYLTYHPKQKPRMGGCLRQINTCHLQVKILKKSRHLGFESIRLLFGPCSSPYFLIFNLELF